MENLQKHTHSDNCLRNKSCHIGFPKPPSTKTLISRPPIDDHDEIIQNAKSALQTLQNRLTTVDIHNISTQHLLQDINVDIVTYIDALKISKKGQMSFCSKTHKIFFINACDHDILSLWGGNVDIQYVINEIAIVKYVCNYMTKGKKGMGETLKRVAKECRNDSIQTHMNKIKKEFLGVMFLCTVSILPFYSFH